MRPQFIEDGNYLTRPPHNPATHMEFTKNELPDWLVSTLKRSQIVKKTITEVIFETEDDEITLTYANGKVTLTSKSCAVTAQEVAILHQAVQELEAQAHFHTPTPTHVHQDHCLG